MEVPDADDFDPWESLDLATLRALRYRQHRPDGTVVAADWLTAFPSRQVSAWSFYLLAKRHWEVENQRVKDGKTRYGLEHIRRTRRKRWSTCSASAWGADPADTNRGSSGLPPLRISLNARPTPPGCTDPAGRRADPGTALVIIGPHYPDGPGIFFPHRLAHARGSPGKSEPFTCPWRPLTHSCLDGSVRSQSFAYPSQGAVMIRPKTSTPRLWIASAAARVLRAALPGDGFPEQGDPWDRVTFRGVRTVDVQVAPIDKSLERDGFSQIQFEADVKLRLLQAGIDVNSSSPVSSERLFVRINAVKSDTLPLYAVSCDLEFRQPVCLMRDPRILASATTWSRSIVELVSSGRAKDFTRQSLANLVDQFTHAYREQIPKE